MVVTPVTRLTTSINQSPTSLPSTQRISTQALERAAQRNPGPFRAGSSELSGDLRQGTCRPLPERRSSLIYGRVLQCGDKAFKILALCAVFWREPKATIAGALIGAATHFIDVQKGPLKTFADMAAFCLDPRTAIETQPLLSQQNNATTHGDRNVRAYRTASICRTAVATALAISVPSHGIIPFAIGWLASKNSLQFIPFKENRPLTPVVTSA
jgi:hypothetical protein